MITEDNTIDLEDGVEYFSIMTIISTKDDPNVRIKVENGPKEYYEGLDEDAYVIIPAAWQVTEQLLEVLKQNLEAKQAPHLTVVPNTGGVH